MSCYDSNLVYNSAKYAHQDVLSGLCVCVCVCVCVSQNIKRQKAVFEAVISALADCHVITEHIWVHITIIR